jgi:hypothetical protein
VVTEATTLQRETQSKGFAMWETHASTLRTAEGLPRRGGISWCGLPPTSLRGVPDKPRVHDVIDVGFALRVKRVHDQGLRLTTKELMQGYWLLIRNV